MPTKKKPKAHDPEHAGQTTSASARTRGAAQRTTTDDDEARPRTGTESVNVNEPSPVTPKVQRTVDRHGNPARVPDASDIADVTAARIILLDASAVVLTINTAGPGQPSEHYRLDAQTLHALRREIDAAALAVAA